MKTILLAMSAASALCVAAPAAAQYGGNAYGRYRQNNYYNQDKANIDARIDRLQARLDAGIQQGTISSREAWSLRRDLSDLRRMAEQYGMDGLNTREQAYLQDRLRTVREEIRVADGGAYDRYDRDRSGSYAYGYDRNGYDNRSSDNGYYGQGGPYEEADQADVCGGYDGVGGACLRVGERATTGLGGIPYDYRDRYRDGAGIYYRSDGRAIYRIDARTNIVLGVYPMDR